MRETVHKIVKLGLTLCCIAVLAGCSGGRGTLPSAPFVPANEGPGESYLIGPLDQLNIFVWRSPELSVSITVRPDGRISIPLINDLAATGKTPSELGTDIENILSDFIATPTVSIMVQNFVGPFSQQVRVVGEAGSPQAIPYRANMTLLDVMIQVGGLTEFAAGNRATLVRFEDGKQKEYNLNIESLIKDGDIDSNVKILPGDVLIIPESFL
ncbi:MAG: polysaccharide export protein [Kordiimonadaceae bacterium]|nr:polysaccharide export protein [Kordiimonadaceae bacterium]